MDWGIVLAADAAAIVLAIGIGIGYLNRQGSRIGRLEHKTATHREELAEMRGELRAHTAASTEVLQRLAVVETEMKTIRGLLERMMDKEN